MASQITGDTRTVHLKDYTPPDFLIDRVDLHFDLAEQMTRVSATLNVRRNGHHARPLLLDGEDLALTSITLDGGRMTSDDYQLTDHRLRIEHVPDSFQLHTETEIHPQRNTALTGLYRSSGNFCTQCEAEGFRRITFFADRPDVLARYTTTIVADSERYPVLLSNGNRIDGGALDDGRHWVTWQDPYPKPSYLFALVAGDLAHIYDEFVTVSGRKVRLLIYSQPHNVDQCAHAMQSLKRAMRWDEEMYGREYDLDVYMIVVVDDFNMGAMENKGLNIFNSQYVIARPDTATDMDYQHIESVIAHEYFHNWSGNRVTCRDWFQLSLKEGFTVFRDQQFSADVGSSGVKRIRDVNILRTHQFREDAGPMAHPVRPESYQEINNFYTLTVYNKGAEVVRMLHRLLGADGFRRGTDRYFADYDGQAVTADDFVAAMERANGVDLTQFRLWYSQAGTPEVSIETRYDASAGTLTLEVSQSCPATPGQPEKQPFLIPLAVALLDDDGRQLPLHLRGGSMPQPCDEQVLALRDWNTQFVFERLDKQPVLSALRGFSAPIKLHIERSEPELCFLMAKDTDPFARWDAAQQLAVGLLLDWIERHRHGQPLPLGDAFVDAYRTNLLSDEPDGALIAELLHLPGESYLTEFVSEIDPDAVHQTRQHLRRSLAETLGGELATVYAQNHDAGGHRIDAVSAGRRALKNVCLSFLGERDDAQVRRLTMDQLESSDNMTDTMAALTVLSNSDWPERKSALDTFYSKWQSEPLVLDKWFMIQAVSHRADTLSRVRTLVQHPAFNIKNPNRVRALIGSFAHANAVRFHETSGDGYEFVADCILELDSLNPQVAARLMTSFNEWRRYEPNRSRLMKAQIERISDTSELSKDVREIATKSLRPNH